MNRDGWIGALLFVCILATFLVSPVRRQSDSRYSVLLSELLVSEGTLSLESVLADPIDPDVHGVLRSDALPYHLDRVDGRILYNFPVGSSILSAPLVAVARSLGQSSIDERGVYDRSRERRIGRVLASIVCACFIVAVYFGARALLGPKESVALAVAMALGTPVWSSASRELWSHDWAIALAATAIALLLHSESRGRAVSPFLLGSLMAWASIVRPTFAVPAALLGLALLWRTPARGIRYAGTGLLWVAGLSAWSLMTFGTWVPRYFNAGTRLSLFPLPEALLANLISPARGFFVYVPIALLVGWLIARRWRFVRLRWLAALAVVVIFAHWWAISSFPHWWGGHSYGPRLMTDTLPWWGLLAVLGLAAHREAGVGGGPLRARFGVEAWIGAALLAVSIGMNAPGAISKQSAYWNAIPIDIEQSPERLWDWKDPAFLRWARPKP